MAVTGYVLLLAVLCIVNHFCPSALIYPSIAKHIRYDQARRRYGCAPLAELPQREKWFGYDFLRTQMAAGKSGLYLKDGFRRYEQLGKTWVARLCFMDWYNTIEPENLKFVLQTSFDDFGLGSRLKSFGPLMGEGIFTTDGAQWKHSRALIRPSFERRQVADLDVFERHIKILLSKIPSDGSIFDLQNMFFQLTLDSATEFLFGESVDSMTSKADSEQDRFGKNFDYAQHEVARRTRIHRWFTYFRFIGKTDPFPAACKEVHTFVDKFVEKILEKKQPTDHEKTGESKKYIFLEALAQGTRDPLQLRHEVLNVLLAGRDTTACLLSHTFFELSRRPDIWAKLTAEVDGLHGKQPTYQELKDSRYLQCLLKESLRLYPVVPSNCRFAKKDVILPRGGGPDQRSPFFLPKGSIIAWSSYSMHRQKDVYGPDADEFRPERWGPEEKLRPGWNYLPFNGGDRVCVGQQFALAEAGYAIVRIVQEFGEIVGDGREWKETLSLTCAIDGGLNVRVVPR